MSDDDHAAEAVDEQANVDERGELLAGLRAAERHSPFFYGSIAPTLPLADLRAALEAAKVAPPPAWGRKHTEPPRPEASDRERATQATHMISILERLVDDLHSGDETRSDAAEDAIEKWWTAFHGGGEYDAAVALVCAVRDGARLYKDGAPLIDYPGAVWLARSLFAKSYPEQAASVPERELASVIQAFADAAPQRWGALHALMVSASIKAPGNGGGDDDEDVRFANGEALRKTVERIDRRLGGRRHP